MSSLVYKGQEGHHSAAENHVLELYGRHWVMRQVSVTLVLFVLSFLDVPLWKAFLVMTRQTTDMTVRSAIS